MGAPEQESFSYQSRGHIARNAVLRAAFAFGESFIRQRRNVLPYYPGNTNNENLLMAVAVRERTVWNFLDFREMFGEALCAAGLELTGKYLSRNIIEAQGVIAQDKSAILPTIPSKPLGELFTIREGTPPPMTQESVQNDIVILEEFEFHPKGKLTDDALEILHSM